MRSFAMLWPLACACASVCAFVVGCGESVVAIPAPSFDGLTSFALTVRGGSVRSIERVGSESVYRASLDSDDSIVWLGVDPAVVARATPYFRESESDELDLVLESPPECERGKVLQGARTRLLMELPPSTRAAVVEASGPFGTARSVVDVEGLASKLTLAVPVSFESCAKDRPFVLEPFGPAPRVVPEGAIRDVLGPASRSRGVLRVDGGRLVVLTWTDVILIEPSGEVPDDGLHVRSFSSRPVYAEIFSAALDGLGATGTATVTVVGFESPGGGLAVDIPVSAAGLGAPRTATTAPKAFRDVQVFEGATYLLEESGRIWRRDRGQHFRVTEPRFSEMNRMRPTGNTSNPFAVLGSDGHVFTGDPASERWVELDNPRLVGVNIWTYLSLTGGDVWLGASKGIIYRRRPGLDWARFDVRAPGLGACYAPDACGWSELPLTVRTLTPLSGDHALMTVDTCSRAVIIRASDGCTVVRGDEQDELGVSEPDGEGALIGGSGGLLYRLTTAR